LTIHTLVQQEEVQETTGTARMRSQNKPHGRSTQGTKCKDLYNDIERRSSQLVAG